MPKANGVLRTIALVAVGLASAFTSANLSTANAQQGDEVVITITRVRAIDKEDIFGRADFYAKITLAGDTITTPVVRNADSIRPNWMLSKRVPRGTHDIKIELLDKDVLKPDDKIDINRVGDKRDLDFKINTANCRIIGFADGYRCGNNIVRAGRERKKARIEFNVIVKR
jgi:hypothetical protein